MKALLVPIISLPYYRGEARHDAAANFVNVDGFYYGYLGPFNVDITGEVDYLIFVSDQKIVGWYGHPTLYKEVRQLPNGHLYQAKAKDSDVILLKEEDRTYGLNVSSTLDVIHVDARLLRYLKQTKRINYRQQDLMVASTIPLTDLATTASFLEKQIVAQDLLPALKLCNQALKHFGQKIVFVYDKAWILYLLNQYRQASFLLNKIKDTEPFKEHVYYMLGNIYFQMGDYDASIQSLLNVTSINLDESAYMLAQAYAMKNDGTKALLWIRKALVYKPEEPAYIDFEKDLRSWQHG